MAISDRLNKLTTDITNAYTSIENKGGTIPANKNTNNLPTAIDSIEVIEQATAEGESISLTNTKAMPYSDYVVEGKSEQEGTPSPSNPSEIHSVADDVNLFDIDNINPYTYQCTYNKTNNKIEIVSAVQTGLSYCILNPKIEFEPNTTYTVSFDYTGNLRSVIMFSNNYTVFGNSSTTNILSFTTTSSIYELALGIYPTTGSSIEVSNIKFQKGTVATPYSPYNQGTVTIKQRGTTENNDYTIQTAPLRSLPNGVKDTIELQDMQNHTRIGRQTGTLTETTIITLSDAKSNGAYMCNIKSAGTLTGQTIELEAGDYEIIYELANEVIEPLTQNQATTMLDIIKTGSYEGTTNIYTDEDVKPTIGVGYYKKG